MGEFIDKVKGEANELIGKAKQAIAEHDGKPTEKNEELAEEGAAQELKGKAQKVAGDVKGALGDKF